MKANMGVIKTNYKQRKKSKPYVSKSYVWWEQHKHEINCRGCNNLVTRKPKPKILYNFMTGRTKSLVCSENCRIGFVGGGRRPKKLWEMWVEKNCGKIFCHRCSKLIKLTKGSYDTYRTKGRIGCQHGCKISKYDYLRKQKLYCTCRKCQKKGKTEQTRIKLEDFTTKQINNFADGKYRKFVSGHKWTVEQKTCKYCKTKFKVINKIHKLHKHSICSIKCRMKYAPTKKKTYELSLEYKFKQKLKFIKYKLEMGHTYDVKTGRFTRKVLYPKWCACCFSVSYAKPSNLILKNAKSGKSRRLLLCKPCAPLAQKRLCFCGMPKRKKSRWANRRFCQIHSRDSFSLSEYRKGIGEMKDNKNKKQVVVEIMELIHKQTKRLKDTEAEILIGLIELQKLNAHKVVKTYSTFLELIDGEYNWSEVKFRSAKIVLEEYGIHKYKEYGRESLQCLSRLESIADRERVFDKMNDYKLKRGGKVPSYRSVSIWVRKFVSQIPDQGSPQKISDLKAKYIRVLEENQGLREQVNMLEIEIAKLNRLLQTSGKADVMIKAMRGKNGRPMERRVS